MSNEVKASMFDVKETVGFKVGPVRHMEDGSLYCDVSCNMFDLARDKLLQMEEEAADAAIKSLGYVKRKVVEPELREFRVSAIDHSEEHVGYFCPECESFLGYSKEDVPNFCPCCGSEFEFPIVGED